MLQLDAFLARAGCYGVKYGGPGWSKPGARRYRFHGELP